MKEFLRVLGIAVLIGYAAALVLMNDAPVRVDLVFTGFDGVPVWLVLLGALLFGGLLAGLGCLVPLMRDRMRLRRARQRIEELEQELHGLRTLPLEGETGEKPRARGA